MKRLIALGFGCLSLASPLYAALKAGDAAPDFKLPTLDKSAQVELASFRGQKPVVLVFGSYT